MTTPATGSTPESRAAALSMFEGQVPCSMQLADPSCEDKARYLAWFTHEENLSPCGWNEPLLLCEPHKSAVAAGSHPFWRTWNRTPPTLCDECGTPLRLERFEPL